MSTMTTPSVRCRACGGLGKHPDNGEPCESCEGEGWKPRLSLGCDCSADAMLSLGRRLECVIALAEHVSRTTASLIGNQYRNALLPGLRDDAAKLSSLIYEFQTDLADVSEYVDAELSSLEEANGRLS